jgi:glycosyltransferase involved in cell wall biosynthesis
LGEIVSFIIPTFNRANVLGKSIQSVLDQTEENWELIIVNDGSTDDTENVVQPYLKDDRVRYVYQENKGVSSARNFGASLANSDYLIFLDSDDIVLPELLKILKVNLYGEFDIICWEVIKSKNGRKKLWKPIRLDAMYKGITATFLAGSICYRKALFNQVGGYDVNLLFGENYELGLRISQVDNLKIKIIHKPLSQYNLPQIRLSNSLSNKLISYDYLYKKHRKLYKSDPKSHSGINYLLGLCL